MSMHKRETASVQAPASMSDSSSERFKLLRNTSLPAGLIQRRQAYQTKQSLGRSPQIKTKRTSEFKQRISVRISGTCPDLSVTHNTPGTPGGPADSATFPMGGAGCGEKWKARLRQILSPKWQGGNRMDQASHTKIKSLYKQFRLHQNNFPCLGVS